MQMDKTSLEERIRADFEAAFAALENAPLEEKPIKEERLNRAVRRLYDLVGYGRVPEKWLSH